MKKFLLLFVCVTMLFVLGTVQANAKNYKEVVLERSKISTKGQNVSLAANEMLVVKLLVRPSNGYQWQLKEEGSKGVAMVLESSPLGVGLPEFEADENIVPGQLMTQIMRIVAQKPGKADLKFVCVRPWEKGSPMDEFNLKATFKGAFAGTFKAPEMIKNPKTIDPSEIYAPGLPSHFDWRDSGGVTSVKNQGSCGSCWAFGTCATFEAKLKIKDGVTRDLSEQYLVSCNSDGFSCSGGWWGHNYHWNKTASGVYYAGARYESEYPYYAYDYSCNTSPSAHEQIEGWYYTDDVSDSAWPNYLHAPTVAQIKQKIYDYGPVGTGICSQTLGSYYSGVYYSNCTGIDHIVLITGWDDSDGCFYVKNSWGTSWGESGYVRMAYGYCQVGYYSTYVIYNESGGGGDAPVADFSGSPTTVSEGGSVSFSDNSSNSPTSWSWSFYGGSPSSSSSQNPTVTYNNAGTYSVYLSVSNSYGSDSVTKTGYITVTSGGGGGYCTSSGSDYSYEWISSVQVGSFSNSSGAAGYSDFTSQTATLTPGSSTSVYLTPGFSSSSYTESWRIWIDYGQDDSFDSSDLEFSGSGSSSVSGSFTVSSSASGTTRMRISMRYNTAPSACGSFDYGEVEDYTVSFGSSPNPAPVANFTASSTSVSEGSTVQFTDTSTNNPTSWTWSFTGGSPSYSYSQNPSVTYNNAGTYSVSLTVSNSGGSDSETKSGYISVSSSGSAPVANFTGSPTTVSEGGSVQFTDTSSNNPTSWTWSFTGGSPSYSYSQNPSVTYNNAGTYNVSLTVSNSYGSDSRTRSGYITVSGGTTSYCSSNGNSTTYEWIAGVQIGSFYNTSGAGSGGYTDFTGQTVSLSPGSSTYVYLTPGFSSSSYTEYWMVWIDYNKNGSFTDSGENVFSGSGSSTVSGSFSVSSSASGSTRMRVSMRYYNAPSSCGSFDYGEVEDYTVSF